MRLSSVSTLIEANGYSVSLRAVLEIGITDERGRSLLGSPQGNGDGIVIETGLTKPIKISIKAFDIPHADRKALQDLFVNAERISLKITDPLDKEIISARHAIFTSSLLNQKVAEGESAENIDLNLEVTPNNYGDERAE